MSRPLARGRLERLVLPRGGRGCRRDSPAAAAAVPSASSVGEGRRRRQLLVDLRRLQQLGRRYRCGRLHLVKRDKRGTY